jgi:hypothetical protein
LEFVVAVQKLREPLNAIEIQAPTNQENSTSQQPSLINNQLSTSHAVRVKSAEYWLERSQADQALRELEALATQAWNHPLAVKARVASIGDLNERSQLTVQE